MGQLDKRRRYGKVFVKPAKTYLTFKALESGTFTLNIPANVNTNLLTEVSYSIDDGTTWVTTNNNATAITITTPTIPIGGKVLWKGIGTSMSKNTSGCKFSSTNYFEASGNIMSLLFGDNYTNLTQLSTPGCFYMLFSNCTKITTAPQLPATTLTNNCYYGIFYNCTSLTVAPQLPATTLADNCYRFMFQNCTSLTTAPSLPATALATYCYAQMFQNCTNLTTTPELPATTLAPGCYLSMFQNCTSLTTAPELPATTLADSCYSGMFSNCTSLAAAPSLPATTLANSCYSNMHNGTNVLPDCSNIDFTSSTVVASGGLIGLFAGTKMIYADLFNILPHDGNNDPTLPVTTLSKNCYLSMFQNCTLLTLPPSLPATTLAEGCYRFMFRGCTSLTTAPSLPATTLADSCYYFMHYGTNVLPDCRNIIFSNITNTNRAASSGVYKGLFAGTKITYNQLSSMLNNSSGSPIVLYDKEIPYCYLSMFQDCTNLTTAPRVIVPISMTKEGFCYNMFSGCTSLTSITIPGATTLAPHCYLGMFSDCTSLTTAPSLPATTLADSCYSGMFLNCSKITSATISAKTLPSNSCTLMFYNCSKLNTVYCKYVTSGTNGSSTRSWLSGVSITGTFYKNSSVTWASGSSGIPYQWTIR